MIELPAAALLLTSVVLLSTCGGSSRSSVASVATSARVVVPATATGLGSSVGSGIRLRVLIGPTCPVQRVGQSCVRPFQASIRVLREPANRIVTTVRSGADGRTTVRLAPGRYLLKPRSGSPYPRGAAQTAVVYAHCFTDVTVKYDSGIR